VAATAAEAAVGTDTGAPSRTTIGLISFGTTVVVVIALFAASVIPLWLAAVILLADGAFTYLLLERVGRETG